MNPRITAEEFASKLEEAPEWRLDVFEGEPLLRIREDGRIKEYFGPDPLRATDREYKNFLGRLSTITHRPEIQINLMR